MESSAKSSIMSDLKSSYSRGDMIEVERLRQEYYNVLASEAKKNGDLLLLNLLAASDECTRNGLMGAASVISTLLAFHSLGKERFDVFCGVVLGPVCSVALEKLSRIVDEEKGETTI